MADKKSSQYQDERRRVIADLLGYFYSNANYPPTEDFELEHEAALRLDIFDDLQREDLIKIFLDSRFGFHLRLYIDSDFWEIDRKTIDQIWPALQEWRRTKRDAHLEVEALIAARPKLKGMSLDRALHLLNQLGLISGQTVNDQPLRYQRVHVRKEILKYGSVQEKVDRGIADRHHDLVFKKPYDPSQAISTKNALAGLVEPSTLGNGKGHSLTWYASVAGIIGTLIAALAFAHQIWGKQAVAGTLNANSVSAKQITGGTIINNVVAGNQSLVMDQDRPSGQKPQAAVRKIGISDSIAATLMVSLRKTNCGGIVRYMQSSKSSQELAWRISGIMDGAGCGMGSGGQFTGAPYGITWEVAPSEENSVMAKALEKAFKDANLEAHKKVQTEHNPGFVLISVGMLR